jgi:glycerol-3-phosphate dehydrogenase
METDVLVIGGGATGGGIAWDLALRGVRVVLAEMGDLATGTSGRYHGLLHSGGRYAVRDPESARECIEENWILRRIAPEAIEDTGGYFVLCPGDDEGYVDQWLRACADVNIPTRPVPLAEARRREPALNPALRAVYEVPDGTCDSWDLLHALQRGAEQTGRATFLTYHRVDRFHRTGDRITGARLTNLRDGSTVDVSAAIIVNAAGPWAAQIAALAGAHFGMRLSRGAMLAYNIRWVNTVINKLRKPGDGDIFVPVGTVSVIGTTSVRTDDPGDTRVEAWEVERILDEAEAMTPGISRARILRAWGGVRPLYDPGGDQRDARRTFTTLDHAADGAPGLISIVGGKLTTFRLMAEQVVDRVCQQLNVTAPCTTATTVLPAHEAPRLHHLRDRLHRLEHGETPGALICECELVTAPQIKAALNGGDVVSLNDLRRDLRLGMGPCQGGFCAFRAAALRHETLNSSDAAHSTALLIEFAERRFGGTKPLLWGHNLRQALLAEHIYGRILGLFGATSVQTRVDYSGVSFDQQVSGTMRVVVIGAGLAGLTAALIASLHGARVDIIAEGQGALTLHPGWIETGPVEALAGQPDHPYAHSAAALPVGLAALHRALPLYPAPGPAITGSGARRTIAYTVGHPLPDLRPDAPILIVGIDNWRESYPRYLADRLRADGWQVSTAIVGLPHRGGNFDDWPLDYANVLDTHAGRQRLIDQLRSCVNGAKAIAFPAVLGFNPSTRAALEDALGAAVVEIPTLPPSVAGMRWYRALRTHLLESGARFLIGSRVTGVAIEHGQASGVSIETAAHGRARFIPADAVILATGGLYAGGIESDYRGELRPAILPEAQLTARPAREDWFSAPFFSGARQPIHAVGLTVDDHLRPLDASGAPLAENLFAAGRILGGTSPVQDGCTEGVDIATGAAAVLHALRVTMGSTYV